MTKEGLEREAEKNKYIKVTKAEFDKCKTLEDKMDYLGKVLSYGIFNEKYDISVWVNGRKNDIINELVAQNKQLQCCANCANCKNSYREFNEFYCDFTDEYVHHNNKCEKWRIQNNEKDSSTAIKKPDSKQEN